MRQVKHCENIKATQRNNTKPYYFLNLKSDKIFMPLASLIIYGI